MNTNKTLFEQIGGTYTQVGDFLLPDLDVEKCEPIGKYGRMLKRSGKTLDRRRKNKYVYHGVL
jgi:hypothetical protein